MDYLIPNLKEILRPRWKHRVGYGFQGDNEVKLDILEQGTTPVDKDLLKKLGIVKNDKVLSIAGYYASWAKEIQKSGARVDYSDISRSIKNWVKKHIEVKFGKYIVSNYELIPKRPEEYDWTFTYEACGGSRGLSIAYLRSLLNKKGGILMMCLETKHKKSNMSKVKRYPSIVKTLANIYKTSCKVEQKQFRVIKRGEGLKVLNFLVCSIYTNEGARKKALVDLKGLDYLKNKSKLSLKTATKALKLTESEFKGSIKRLSLLSAIPSENFVRKIKVD